MQGGERGRALLALNYLHTHMVRGGCLAEGRGGACWHSTTCTHMVRGGCLAEGRGGALLALNYLHTQMVRGVLGGG